ncbi:hypothetical protein NUU61_002977 [Penicillium alfredii]|uniref:Uncharacterized protein n=1 Tax=Penicillium alfredii TaxID=1506179 RepID=A0A9W9KGI6_9EURO|nr:uncharacterized protein NUU61_002977 [Penicillium alfredii]KAJ5105630.1 hypothetical protein NUU61_002977 [Penicillium alfredii]
MATNQTHLSEREALDIVHNITGYTFINPEPFYQALLTPSPLNPEGNKGLALIDSQTLRLVLATEGYRRQAPRGKGSICF